MSAILITLKAPQLLTAGGKLAGMAVAKNARLKLHEVSPPPPACTIENIHWRAEAMTRLLKEIPTSHPEPRWGINE